MKILIVDDNQDIREVLSKIIKLEGHEVVTAKNGKEALAMIENNLFAAVFLDLLMPESSGLEVIDSLAKSGRIILNKIIVITATSILSVELQKLKKKGVWTWMRKPIHYYELQNILRTI